MSVWTLERVDRLKQLWADGLSASDIARSMGCFSHCDDGGRHAVIGKVHRLGLASRVTTTRPKIHGTPRAKRKYTKPRNKPFSYAKPRSKLSDLFQAEPYVPPAEELVIPVNERKTVDTLTETSCRWPIGDPQQPEFHFCGRKKIHGLPYCEVHARRAYQPPQPRRPAPAVPVPAEAEMAEAMDSRLA